MGHIHTETGHHDWTVSMFLVRENNGNPEVLMHFHKKLQQWLQFGGHVELDEHPWSAVAHELTEETGYTLDDVKLYQPHDAIRHLTGVILHPQPVVVQTHAIGDNHYHTDLSYALYVTGEPTVPIAAHEQTQQQWMTLQDVVDGCDDESWKNKAEIVEYIFTTVMKRWEKVDTRIFRS